MGKVDSSVGTSSKRFVVAFFTTHLIYRPNNTPIYADVQSQEIRFILSVIFFFMEWSLFANIRRVFNKHHMQFNRAETAVSTQINEPQNKLQSNVLCGFPIKAVLLCVYGIHVATVKVPVVRINQNKDIYINVK